MSKAKSESSATSTPVSNCCAHYSSDGYGESAHMSRFALASVAQQCGKYQNLMHQLIS